MGLDNGLEVRSKNGKIQQLIESYSIDGCNYVYWRSWYNLRDKILDILSRDGIDANASNVELSINHIREILKLFEHLNRRTWKETHWEYKDCKWGIRKSKKALRRLIKLLKKYPNQIEVTFYDSY